MSGNKAEKRATREKARREVNGSDEATLFSTDHRLPAIVFQHLKMKHIHLAFRKNGFNKGRAERWGNTDD